MALEKVQTIDRIEVLEDGSVQVRTSICKAIHTASAVAAYKAAITTQGV